MTDPIADMLSRIRNAAAANHDQISLPHSKLKEAVVRLLAANSYLGEVKVVKDVEQPQLMISLRASGMAAPPIAEIKRLSRPGRRLYVKSSKIPTVKHGRGLVIISTAEGLMSGQEAKAKHLGGELICEIY